MAPSGKSSENSSSLWRHDSIICPWSDGNRLKLCIINSLTSHLLYNKNIVVNAYKTCKLSVKITCLLSCSFLRTLKNFLCSSYWYLKVKNYGKCPLAKKMCFFFSKKNFFLRNLFTPSSFFEKNVRVFTFAFCLCLFVYWGWKKIHSVVFCVTWWYFLAIFGSDFSKTSLFLFLLMLKIFIVLVITLFSLLNCICCKIFFFFLCLYWFPF